MKTYAIKLRLRTHFLTPFHADTVFGHLCWAVAHHDGDAELREFLEPFKRGAPPFVVSDGFPSGFLCKPLFADFQAASEERKKVRKMDFVRLEEFNALMKGDFVSLEKSDIPVQQSAVSHSVIDRLSSTTLAEGGVYTQAETFTPFVTIHMKTVSEGWRDRVLKLFELVSLVGYGGKKSVGKGWFEVEEIEEAHFLAPDHANGFVALCGFCPAHDDPTAGTYRTFVKYGKLGEEFTHCGNPFKRPLLMIKAGSVFGTGGPPKEYYGRMVERIAPAKPEVIQYAYAFAVPIRLTSLERPSEVSSR